MLKRLEHRGPDGRWIRSINNCSIGVCRLSIFGDENASQPLLKDGALVAFNGEIYNYKELCDELNQGFTTECELIHSLFLRFREQAFSKLRGMFSIVLATPDEIFLTRDAMGIKPLYYCKKSSRLIFASEIKAILNHKDYAVGLDEEALSQCAVFGYISDPETTCFKGICQVPPGSYVHFDGTQFNKFCFFKPHPAFFNGSHESDRIVEDFEQRLEKSASLMINHGRGGRAIYLSGGLDSSIMTALLSRQYRGTIHTFTLADSPHHEDFIWARKVANHFKTEHHEFVVDLQECLDWLPHFIYHFENPMLGGVFDQFGSLAFHILSSKVAKIGRIAFCGEGADELFGGYYWLHTHPLGFADRLRTRAKGIGATSTFENLEELFPERAEDERTFQMRVFDLLVGTGLSNCHLWSVDRSSSAFSFEARPLYLDNAVVDFALAQPINLKAINKAETKILLRHVGSEIFRGTGLEEIVLRKKLGMPAAIENIGAQINAFAREIIQRADFEPYPLSFFPQKPLDRLLFDLFTYIFISRAGCDSIPTLSEFVLDSYGIDLDNSFRF